MIYIYGIFEQEKEFEFFNLAIVSSWSRHQR